MIDFVVRMTIMVILVAVADNVFLRKRASAAFRHMLWAGSVCALLLMPFLGFALPEWRVPVLTPQPSSAPAVEYSGIATEPVRAVATRTSASTTSAPVSRDAEITWPVAVASAYAVIALLLLVKIAVELRSARAMSRSGVPLTDPAWQGRLHSARSSLGLRRDVLLLRSDDRIMPLTFGVLRPVVVLPRSVDEWSEDRRGSVLLHELAHVARYDCATQVIAAVACALYWPHPGVWYAAYRMRIEREYACDDATIVRGVSPRAYALDLLEIARNHSTPARLGTVAISMATTAVESRLRAVIDERRKRSEPRAVTKLYMALLLVATVVPVSTLRAVERATPSAALQSRTIPDSLPPAVSTRVDPAPRGDAVEGAARNVEPIPETPPPAGEWTLRIGGPDEPGNAAAAFVILRTPGMNTFYVPLGALTGLDAQTIERGGSVVFQLDRGAGTLTFTGTFEGGRGRGTFTFTPDDGFAADLVKRGMRKPTNAEMFTLARHGLGVDLLDALAAAGYAQPTTEIFVRASLTSVDAVYVRNTAARGIRKGTLEGLISYYNNSGSSDEDTAPASAGPVKATPLSGHWTLDRYRNDVTQLELFWTDGTNWRRDIVTNELKGSLSNGSFSIQRDAGTFEFAGEVSGSHSVGKFVFKPNREFTNTLRSLGVVMNETVSDHTLKNLAWGGLDAQDVRDFQTLGLTPLTLRDVVDLAIFEVRPAFLRELRTKGTGVTSAEDLIDAWRSRNKNAR